MARTRQSSKMDHFFLPTIVTVVNELNDVVLIVVVMKEIGYPGKEAAGFGLNGCRWEVEVEWTCLHVDLQEWDP